MAENSLGLFFEISADPSKAVQALSNFRGASDRELKTVNSHFNAIQSSAEQARRGLEGSFGQMARSVEVFGEVSFRIFDLIAQSLLRNMELERLDVLHKSRAEASKTLVSKQSVKELAAVKAVESFAKGLEALGDFNFASAAHYFAAAALYGSLAAIQVAGLFSSAGASRGHAPGRESSPAPGGTGARFGGPTAPSSSAPTGAAGAGNVTVMVVGESGAAQWVANVLNQHVLQNDGRLVASHTRRPAPAGR